MKRPPKKLLIVAGAVVLLVVVAVVALPVLIDVNSYRGLIEARARETLGRDVRMGELGLSLWPFGVRVDDLAIAALPDEGGGDLLTAESLRVGARLLPLLGKRLEVRSIVVVRPRMVAARGPDGQWNLERLIARPDAKRPDERATDEPARFSLGTLRLSEGRLTLRDAGPGRKRPLELTLAGLDLRIDDLTPDRPFGISVSAKLEGLEGAGFRLAGRAGPLAPAAGTPMSVAGEIALERIEGTRLVELLDGIVVFPAGMLGARPFSVSAKLDGAMGAVTRLALSDLVVQDLDLGLERGRDGSFKMPSLVSTAAPAPAGGPAPEIELSGVRVTGTTVRYKDASAGDPALELTLDQLDLTLDRLPTQGKAQARLAARLASGGERGELKIEGSIGPTGKNGSMPAKLAVELRSIPPRLLGLALEGATALDFASAKTSLVADIEGELPERVDVRGSLALGGVKARITGADGSTKMLPIDLDARYDVASRRGGAELEARSLEIALGKSKLALSGSVRQEGQRRRLDLELLPSSIPADDLSALLVLAAGELPVAFGSKSPVELHARARGLYGEGSMPEIEADAKLRDLVFRHPTMAEPIEQVSADVSVRGERVEVRGLSGVIGSSDIGGELSLAGFEEPRIRFDLQSRKADFGELFSFLRSDAETTAGASGGDPLGGLSLDGRIRIENGSFQTLDFGKLDATMSWNDGQLTLAPVGAALYGGSFAGRITSDFRGERPAFTVRGNVRELDVQAFLADNLDSPDLLSGRFTGAIETAGSGLEYEAIIRGLTGSGTMEVRQGRVGKLDVLKTVAKVSGVFGETSLKSLSKRMAKEGTGFERLSSSLRLSDGKMAFDDLLLESPDFQLQGRGTVGMLTAKLDGQFRLILSRDVSQAMRAEKSKAGELFWSSKSQQVEMPFSMSGPFDAPTPGIDFKSVTRDAVKDRAEDKFRKLVGDKLGLEPGEPAPIAPGTPPPSAPAGPAAPPPGAAAPRGGLTAEISGIRWGGSVLAKDLKLQGAVRGSGIRKASLSVIDAGGVEVRSWDRLKEVEEYVAATADAAAQAAIDWKVTVDGKRLLLAKFPLTVKLVVTGADGDNATVERQVER